MKNYLLLLAITGPLLLGACKKDDEKEPDPEPATVTQPAPINPLTSLTNFNPGSDDPAAIQLTKDLLVNTRWELSSFLQVSPNTIIYKDLFSGLPSCQKDDIYKFDASGNALTITDGLNTCGGNPITKTGTWSISNSANLTFSVANLQTGLTGTFNVVQLSESEMVLKQVTNGIVYLATYEKHIPTMAEMLVSKNWVMTDQVRYDYYNGTTTNLFAGYPACKTDNFMRFDVNNQLSLNEGPTKCSSSDPQAIQGSWNLNYSSLYLNSPAGNTTLYIQELSATRLVTRENVYNTGYQASVTSTYVAQ
jgi:hypothetical protein